MIESHVKDEISEQLDYYVDAYKRYCSISHRCAELSAKLSALENELGETMRLREHAEAALNALIEDIEDPSDVAEVESIVAGKIGGIVDSMVVS